MCVEVDDADSSVCHIMQRHKSRVCYRMVAAQQNRLVAFRHDLLDFFRHILQTLIVLIMNNIITISEILKVNFIVVNKSVVVYIEKESVLHSVHNSRHRSSYAVGSVSCAGPSSSGLCVII